MHHSASAVAPLPLYFFPSLARVSLASFSAWNRARMREAYPSLLSCFVRPIASASGGTFRVTVVPVAT